MGYSQGQGMRVHPYLMLRCCACDGSIVVDAWEDYRFLEPHRFKVWELAVEEGYKHFEKWHAQLTAVDFEVGSIRLEVVRREVKGK